ncbi:single-stranded DNA-binding protein [Brevibacillus sp. SIMBA_040]|uniref:single-stranded DNA-binding protein n=1 Tax=unclassified Brevibacillus TaxID=2684853 RepID=UPI00397CB8A6
MNRVFLIGYLSRDPEMRYTPNGVAVTTFTLAVNRPKSKDGAEQQPDWINSVVWQKTAENCANYLRKGSKVLLEGRIQTRSYEDKEGNKRYVTEVVGDNVQFLSPKNQDNTSAEPFSPRPPVNISDDDLPF